MEGEKHPAVLSFKMKILIVVLYIVNRFPHIKPGKQKPVGDHFMALFPVTEASFDVSSNITFKRRRKDLAPLFASDSLESGTETSSMKKRLFSRNWLRFSNEKPRRESNIDY